MLSRYRGKTLCDSCEGNRLKKEAGYVKIKDKNIFDLINMQLVDLEKFIQNINLENNRIINEIRQRIIIDMAFNMGVPRLGKFKKMWKAIEEENFEEAKIQMLDSRWANQVGNRAVRLSNAMETGEWV